MHRTVASAKTQRRQGVTRTSQRTDPEMQNPPGGAGKLWCARPARKGAVEGWRTAAASCGRDARTTMVQPPNRRSRSNRPEAPTPLHTTLSEGAEQARRSVLPPHVTLSEGVRRPSRRVRGSVGRSSPERNAIDRSALPTRRGCFDSLRSLSMTWKRATPRRSRRAGGTTGRGSGRARRTLVFGEADRFPGGCGRRLQPTPPSGAPFMIPSRLCVFALATVATLRCAMAQIKCDGCDDFVCDVFAPSRLRACDGCDVVTDR